MFELSNRADIVLSDLITRFQQGVERIDVKEGDPDVGVYEELKKAEMIEAIGAWSAPVIVITGITPGGMTHFNKVNTIKESWGIPILSRDADYALRQLDIDSPLVDERFLAAYRELSRAGLISASYADNEVFFIKSVTEEGRKYLRGFLPTAPKDGNDMAEVITTSSLTNKVFVVHGHNEGLREAVARLLEKQGLEPIVLMEQANEGLTIIEKFEKHSDVSAAICLFTGDDEVIADGKMKQSKRARQNVILEAGYFIGKLGRNRVIVVSSGDVEMPSDLAGVLYVDTDSWKLSILKELSSMGYPVSADKLL